MWSPNHRSITKPTCRRKRKLDMVYKVEKYERMKHIAMQRIMHCHTLQGAGDDCCGIKILTM